MTSVIATERQAVLDRFTTWAEDHGVVIDGVKAAYIPGCGIGLVATRQIEEDEEVIAVQECAFLTPLSPQVRSLFVQRLQAGHAIRELGEPPSGISKLAAYLALNPSIYPEWQRTWPTMADVRASFPYFWPIWLQNSLPIGTLQKVRLQVAIVGSEWEKVRRHCTSKQLLDAHRDPFEYYYFIVNSRTMYWGFGADSGLMGMSGSRRSRMGEPPAIPAHDRIAMCPYLDLVNHLPSSEPAIASDCEYALVTAKPYSVGEEVTVSYGGRDDDTLLVEYGFMLGPDCDLDDSVPLDDMMLPAMSDPQKSFLSSYLFLGEYNLSSARPSDGRSPVKVEMCFRTEVALLYLALGDCPAWHQYREGLTDGHGGITSYSPLLFRTAGVVAVKRQVMAEIDRGNRVVKQLTVGREGRWANSEVAVATAAAVSRWQVVIDQLRAFLKLMEG